MKKTLILLRGVQGSGKTELAEFIRDFSCGGDEQVVLFGADDHFTTEDGTYEFDLSRLELAHKECYKNAVAAMKDERECIVVHNPFSRAAELTPYFKSASEYGYRVFSLVVENRHGNKDVHNVPSDVREEMAKRIKSSLKLV